jgi:hypothetical protein
MRATRLEDDMAIGILHKRLELPNAEATIRYVQYDSVRITIDREGFDNGLVKLTGSARHPGKRVSRRALKALLETSPIDITKKHYDVVITNAQSQKLIAFLEKGSYFYKTQGSPNDAKFVLAFSFGEGYAVNSKIRYEIEKKFGGGKSDLPKIYAQWEIADIPELVPGAGLKFHRVGIEPGKHYINSCEVAEKFCKLSKAKRGDRVFLACQAWHGPRCWRICEKLELKVVGGIFVNLFSCDDAQPWVRHAMSLMIKESRYEKI